MQNLTARYNYIYNANILLEDYVSELYASFPNNFNAVLPVHLSPQKFNPDDLSSGSPDKALDEILNKARTIITDKSLSKYLDEAYLLMGKSQFYKGNFFLAAEYFDYVARTYKNQPKSLLQGLDWQARSLMMMNDFKTAATVCDSLEKHLGLTRKDRAEPLATLAQLAINLNDAETAINYLTAAIAESKTSRNTIRWHFTLAQLFQAQEEFEQAAAHYRKVQRSNGAFDLYFHAGLNLIAVDAAIKGDQTGRAAQLTALVKDEKNEAFKDQLYFEIASLHLQNKHYTEAASYFDKAIANSGSNNTLKGLAYLQLAELRIAQQQDYRGAKQYYDLSLSNLPKAYPSYAQIEKKSQNLDYLASRYQIIANEDSLQLLAALPAPEREIRARLMRFSDQPDTAANQRISADTTVGNSKQPQRSGKSYFQNKNAMEKGYADFIKRWGNRKYEDNWRQSIKTNVANTILPAGTDPLNAQMATDNLQAAGTDSIELANFLALVPVDAAMLQASNERIVNAYIELASFYSQELKANKEAAGIYELVLDKYPKNSQLALINYSLYLLYKDADKTQAEKFKTEVLNNHASSVYARIILDPNYSINQNTLDQELNTAYSKLFDHYLQKDFAYVIQLVDQALAKNAQHRMAAQFAYLKAIAVGRTQPVDSLLQQFQFIKQNYPQDRLIVPLVNEHLSYINANLEAFKRRKVALTDFDPNEPPFSTPVQLAAKPTDNAGNNRKAQPDQPALKVQEAGKATDPTPQITSTGPFKNAPSATWYFVIDVADATIRLSSSRFGIGQFSRGNYPEADLRHQLVEFDNDQLIYVGNFSNFEAAKSFQERITPQLNRIMRVQPSLYKTFIISKENFDIIKSKSLLNQYLEFYNNNY